ncbi:MAG TPA: HAMP domain-containing sensor histidine kinase [Saprospiraceae bacterium]|nr:HAMP domain-containing sensor histidine kinase [Saprospiraceae bacterium]
MNKKAIWAIIGLMTISVVCVAWLQWGLIRTAIRVNEEKFDKTVFGALAAVANRLEDEERKEAMNFYSNGYLARFMERQNSSGNVLDKQLLEIEFKLKQNRPGIPASSLASDIFGQLTADTCKCYNCMLRRENSYETAIMAYTLQNTFQPLEQRINAEGLAEILDQELKNRGIDTQKDFGVFSNLQNDFVIANGHYLVSATPGPESGPSFKDIFASKYKVTLFNQDEVSPGLLMVHFPAKSSVVWGSVWPNLLGTIAFAAITMLCFGYTINVIFRQKKVSEMKTDFINNMTHEFKTPIATISLAADSITSPMILGQAEKVQRFANIIKQENKRMNNQVEKVLQMALIDRQEVKLKADEVNVNDIIHHAVENISLQVEKKDGTVQYRLEAENPVIEGDMTHIANVINNLLDNANKYSPEKPDITVSTRNVQGGLEIVVADKGIGMNKEARKHIFDKFYRVHTGNLHDVKGFGLGLSYVKAMMDAHKGTVDVKSEPGKGSSFILYFPFRQEAKIMN